ncbi:hypothetical protein JXJ21_06495 [candidate division KSB1 bacterium]|nr:hypothetical protein [candidate division KSB1 bacterium]
MAKAWTREEEAYLYQNYNAMTNAQLADLFGVTPKAISHKMRRLRDRARREAEKRERARIEFQRQQKQAAQKEEALYLEEEVCEPLNLPKIRLFEKRIDIDGHAISLISTGFFVKTEAGWTPIMMKKRKLYQ